MELTKPQSSFRDSKGHNCRIRVRDGYFDRLATRSGSSITSELDLRAVRTVISYWFDETEERRELTDGPLSVLTISISFKLAPAPFEGTPRALKTASLAAHLPANDASGSGADVQYAIYGKDRSSAKAPTSDQESTTHL